MKKVITTMSALTLTVPTEEAKAVEYTPLTQDELTMLSQDDLGFKGSGFIDLSVTKTVVLSNDHDMDGEVTMGDQLTYHITINNLDPDHPANGLFVADVIDPRTDLILGSVSTSLGQVLNGNLPGDNDSFFTVDIPTIPADWFAIINFDVLVGELDEGTNALSNQAEVFGPSGAFFVSDDPSTATAFDPTIIEAQGPIPDLIFQDGFERTAPSGGF